MLDVSLLEALIGLAVSLGGVVLAIATWIGMRLPSASQINTLKDDLRLLTQQVHQLTLALERLESKLRIDFESVTRDLQQVQADHKWIKEHMTNGVQTNLRTFERKNLRHKPVM